MKFLACLFLITAACATQPSSAVCERSGIVCPEGTKCAAVQAVCIINDCGDGVVNAGEVCDDGNIINGDGCSSDCRSKESCGDGLVSSAGGELCDDGNTNDGDGCSHDCKSLEVCGNGIKDFGEACDDGNTAPGDGCSANCKSTESCGNGVVDTTVGEVCDPPGPNCGATCRSVLACGNGVVDVGEECDHGQSLNGDDKDCTADCHLNVCGDGKIDTAGSHVEQCDGGTT